MWLVLCDPADVSALWAGQGLRARGIAPVEFVSPVQLICAQRFEYRSERCAPVRAWADLSDGRQIDSSRVRGTINRATRVDYPQLKHAGLTDRPYVQAELDAIFLAWLGALAAPVFNPAQPSGWSGQVYHPFAWALRAQRAGFSTMPYRCGYSGLEFPRTPSGQVTNHLVFRGRVFPTLSEVLTSAACQLSEDSGIPLLGISLAWSAEGQAVFCGATPTPDLRTGGTEFLDALSMAISAT